MSRHITKVHLRELSLYDDGTYKHADHYVNNTYCGAHCYVRDSIHEYEGSVLIRLTPQGAK